MSNEKPCPAAANAVPQLSEPRAQLHLPSEKMGKGTNPKGTFLPQEHSENEDYSAAYKPGYHGISNFLCRRISVPLITLVLLSSAALGFLIAVIIMASGKENEVPEAPPARPLPDLCADGWIWYGGKCYLFSENLGNWDEAQNFCTSQSSSLAHIETLQELDFLMQYKGPYGHWIGLRREPGRPWKWTDLSEFNNMFTILQDSDCVYLNDVAARSAGCNTKRKLICNMPAWSPF